MFDVFKINKKKFCIFFAYFYDFYCIEIRAPIKTNIIGSHSDLNVLNIKHKFIKMEIPIIF